jgi:hypothetical protein
VHGGEAQDAIDARQAELDAQAEADAINARLSAIDARLATVDTKSAYARKVLLDYREQVAAGQKPTPPTDDAILAAFVVGGLEQ